MQANPSEVAGRIVLVKEQWEGYRTAVRRNLNIEAQKLGAVAAMIRSVGPFSLDSPHTGSTGAAAGSVSSAIPTIALTVENAEMISRMFGRCPSATGCIRIELYMEATNNVPGTNTPCASDECTPSRNTIVDVVGSQFPDEIVLLSGHLDSWDVGFGAMDDGGGVFISLQVCSMLRRLNIRPLRTVRCVGWTSEEMGSQGSRRYWSDHAGDLSDFSAVFESDGGVFDTKGIGLSASLAAHAIVRRVAEMLTGIDGSAVGARGGGADISGAMSAGVPGGTIQTKANNVFQSPITSGPDRNANIWGQDELHFQGDYFMHHHTSADNVSTQVTCLCW
jgi:carboxypeptidase Q